MKPQKLRSKCTRIYRHFSRNSKWKSGFLPQISSKFTQATNGKIRDTGHRILFPGSCNELIMTRRQHSHTTCFSTSPQHAHSHIDLPRRSDIARSHSIAAMVEARHILFETPLAAAYLVGFWFSLPDTWARILCLSQWLVPRRFRISFRSASL